MSKVDSHSNPGFMPGQSGVTSGTSVSGGSWSEQMLSRAVSQQFSSALMTKSKQWTAQTAKQVVSDSVRQQTETTQQRRNLVLFGTRRPLPGRQGQAAKNFYNPTAGQQQNGAQQKASTFTSAPKVTAFAEELEAESPEDKTTNNDAELDFESDPLLDIDLSSEGDSDSEAKVRSRVGGGAKVAEDQGGDASTDLSGELLFDAVADTALEGQSQEALSVADEDNSGGGEGDAQADAGQEQSSASFGLNEAEAEATNRHSDLDILLNLPQSDSSEAQQAENADAGSETSFLLQTEQQPEAAEAESLSQTEESSESDSAEAPSESKASKTKPSAAFEALFGRSSKVGENGSEGSAAQTEDLMTSDTAEDAAATEEAASLDEKFMADELDLSALEEEEELLDASDYDAAAQSALASQGSAVQRDDVEQVRSAELDTDLAVEDVQAEADGQVSDSDTDGDLPAVARRFDQDRDTEDLDASSDQELSDAVDIAEDSAGESVGTSAISADGDSSSESMQKISNALDSFFDALSNSDGQMDGRDVNIPTLSDPVDVPEGNAMSSRGIDNLTMHEGEASAASLELSGTEIGLQEVVSQEVVSQEVPTESLGLSNESDLQGVESSTEGETEFVGELGQSALGSSSSASLGTDSATGQGDVSAIDVADGRGAPAIGSLEASAADNSVVQSDLNQLTATAFSAGSPSSVTTQTSSVQTNEGQTDPTAVATNSVVPAESSVSDSGALNSRVSTEAASTAVDNVLAGGRLDGHVAPTDVPAAPVDAQVAEAQVLSADTSSADAEPVDTTSVAVDAGNATHSTSQGASVAAGGAVSSAASGSSADSVETGEPVDGRGAPAAGSQETAQATSQTATPQTTTSQAVTSDLASQSTGKPTTPSSNLDNLATNAFSTGSAASTAVQTSESATVPSTTTTSSVVPSESTAPSELTVPSAPAAPHNGADDVLVGGRLDGHVATSNPNITEEVALADDPSVPAASDSQSQSSGESASVVSSSATSTVQNAEGTTAADASNLETGEPVDGRGAPAAGSQESGQATSQTASQTTTTSDSVSQNTGKPTTPPSSNLGNSTTNAFSTGSAASTSVQTSETAPAPSTTNTSSVVPSQSAAPSELTVPSAPATPNNGVDSVLVGGRLDGHVAPADESSVPAASDSQSQSSGESASLVSSSAASTVQNAEGTAADAINLETGEPVDGRGAPAAGSQESGQATSQTTTPLSSNLDNLTTNAFGTGSAASASVQTSEAATAPSTTNTSSVVPSQSTAPGESTVPSAPATPNNGADSVLVGGRLDGHVATPNSPVDAPTNQAGTQVSTAGTSAAPSVDSGESLDGRGVPAVANQGQSAQPETQTSNTGQLTTNAFGSGSTATKPTSVQAGATSASSTAPSSVTGNEPVSVAPIANESVTPSQTGQTSVQQLPGTVTQDSQSDASANSPNTDAVPSAPNTPSSALNQQTTAFGTSSTAQTTTSSVQTDTTPAVQTAPSSVAGNEPASHAPTANESATPRAPSAAPSAADQTGVQQLPGLLTQDSQNGSSADSPNTDAVPAAPNTSSSAFNQQAAAFGSSSTASATTSSVQSDATPAAPSSVAGNEPATVAPTVNESVAPSVPSTATSTPDQTGVQQLPGTVTQESHSGSAANSPNTDAVPAAPNTSSSALNQQTTAFGTGSTAQTTTSSVQTDTTPAVQTAPSLVAGNEPASDTPTANESVTPRAPSVAPSTPDQTGAQQLPGMVTQESQSGAAANSPNTDTVPSEPTTSASTLNQQATPVDNSSIAETTVATAQSDATLAVPTASSSVVGSEPVPDASTANEPVTPRAPSAAPSELVQANEPQVVGAANLDTVQNGSSSSNPNNTPNTAGSEPAPSNPTSLVQPTTAFGESAAVSDTPNSVQTDASTVEQNVQRLDANVLKPQSNNAITPSATPVTTPAADEIAPTVMSAQGTDSPQAIVTNMSVTLGATSEVPANEQSLQASEDVHTDLTQTDAVGADDSQWGRLKEGEYARVAPAESLDTAAIAEGDVEVVAKDAQEALSSKRFLYNGLSYVMYMIRKQMREGSQERPIEPVPAQLAGNAGEQTDALVSPESTLDVSQAEPSLDIQPVVPQSPEAETSVSMTTQHVAPNVVAEQLNSEGIDAREAAANRQQLMENSQQEKQVASEVPQQDVEPSGASVASQQAQAESLQPQTALEQTETALSSDGDTQMQARSVRDTASEPSLDLNNPDFNNQDLNAQDFENHDLENQDLENQSHQKNAAPTPIETNELAQGAADVTDNPEMLPQANAQDAAASMQARTQQQLNAQDQSRIESSGPTLPEQLTELMRQGGQSADSGSQDQSQQDAQQQVSGDDRMVAAFDDIVEGSEFEFQIAESGVATDGVEEYLNPNWQKAESLSDDEKAAKTKITDGMNVSATLGDVILETITTDAANRKIVVVDNQRLSTEMARLVSDVETLYYQESVGEMGATTEASENGVAMRLKEGRFQSLGNATLKLRFVNGTLEVSFDCEQAHGVEFLEQNKETLLRQLSDRFDGNVRLVINDMALMAEATDPALQGEVEMAADADVDSELDDMFDDVEDSDEAYQTESLQRVVRREGTDQEL